MARIVVVTEQGEVVEQFNSDEWGDLNRPMPSQLAWAEIKGAIERAEKKDKND